MPEYSNGYVPDSLLVTFDSGWSKTDGNWKHQLSPSTLRKHRALVERSRKRTGRTLKISEGGGAYRPYHIQVIARTLYGNGAAWPGTSSHGGFWERKQTLAIDYGNWGYVYDWDRAAFFADVRAVGLEPDLISPRRGYPDEPRHVVDLDPWAAVPSGGNSVEDDMTEDERRMLKEVHSMLLETRDYIGARGGHNTKTPNTIGHMVREIRDYLGAGGGKGTRSENTIGAKVNAVFARWVKNNG